MFTLCEMLRFLFCLPDSASADGAIRLVVRLARGRIVWLSQK